MTRNLSFVLLLSVWALGGVNAEEPKCDDLPRVCLAKEHEKELMRLNAELSGLMKQAMHRFEESTGEYPDVVKEWKKRLRGTQAAWIKYRIARCEEQFWADSPGTGAGAMGDTCLIRLTRERIRDLRESYLEE